MPMHAYRVTLYASYIGYITQAIVNNLPSLLFVTFTLEFSVTLEQIGSLIAINFITQMITDTLAGRYIDKIGYKIAMILADILAIIGLLSFSVLPYFIEPYVALLIAMVFAAIGGGLCEVLVSPIVESLPLSDKENHMSLLHSFYSWGQAAVVLIATLYFIVFGISNWRILPLIFMIVPFIDAILFYKAKIIEPRSEKNYSKGPMFKDRAFKILIVIMACAGASEITMSQWSSLFAEEALGVSKTIGDLLGPMAFALCMGLARLYYSKKRDLKIEDSLLTSSNLCIISYLLVVLSPIPLLSLLGCALCGSAVGFMWPGTFSLAAGAFPKAGTAMFAILALAGDVGCALGPFITGQVSGLLHLDTDVSLRVGLAFGALFPFIMSIVLLKKRSTSKL